MSKQALLDKRCIIPKGGPIGAGDARYRYKAYWCMTTAERERARSRYPHNTAGIPDSAYAYPIDSKGYPPSGNARRVLLWSYKHVVRKVGKHRAAQLSGARRRR